MRWVKRGLWVTAWGAWLAAGVGLYWQLPREVGPKVCEIPLARSERLVGFIKGGRELLVQPEQFMRPVILNVYDAETGRTVRGFSLGDRLPQLPLDTCRSHGVVVARGQGRQLVGLEVMDLESGRWTRVTDKLALNVMVHPERPWVAFREQSGPADKRRPLAVVDWTTGEEVFSLAPSPYIASVGPSYFLGGARLAVSVVRRDRESRPDEAPTDLQVWKLGSPAHLERTVSINDFRSRPRHGGTSLLAWLRQRKGAVRDVAVYDIDAERELLAVEWATDVSIPFGTEEFLLSRSGRTLLAGRPAGVWDVGTGTPRWTAPPGQTIQHGHEDLDAFSVLEAWDQSWTRGKLQHWSTVAVRDLDASEFRFRCWEKDAEILKHRSDDGSLGVVVGAKNLLGVWRLPFRVNWALLALCQTILAIPLVLIWAVTWSRKRRRRAAPLPV